MRLKFFYILKDPKIEIIRYEGVHTCVIDEPVSEPTAVDSIPFDIDGDILYHVRVNKEAPWKSVEDGRNWGGYMPCGGQKGATSYQRSCRGELWCCQWDDCDFFKKNGKRNNSQFETSNGKKVCRECQNEVGSVECSAKKFLLWKSEKKDLLIVRHAGVHKCSAVPRSEVPREEIEHLLSFFPTLRPAQIKNIIIKKAIQDGSPPSVVRSVADQFVNRGAVQRRVMSARRILNPYGHSMKAVRSYCEQIKSSGHDVANLIPFMQNHPGIDNICMSTKTGC